MSSLAIPKSSRRLFILWDDWTWWAWTVTAILLAIGFAGYPEAFVAAIAITALQLIAMVIRERSLSAFAVQLRMAYLILLGICFVPQMRWLYWLPMLGTFALVIFGYCLLARMLYLLPWNREEPLSMSLLRRTFLSRPNLSRFTGNPHRTGCAGGLCTIAAQVHPRG